MTSKTPEEKLQYILTCLKHCDAVKPNYHKVAAETSLTSANTAQKIFKKYVEDAGFQLVNGQVRGDDGSGAAAPTTPAKKTPAKKARTPKTKTPKKDLGNDSVGAEEDDNIEADKKPAIKKRKLEANGNKDGALKSESGAAKTEDDVEEDI